VVDGLPSALVVGDAERPPGMPFTKQLVHSGSAIGFKLKAKPPTVTLPRLKALTSGILRISKRFEKVLKKSMKKNP
jgi:predicted AlkP superfamily pyrophosphatase or phosphodiesterase